MSKKLTGKRTRENPILTIATFGFTIVALPLFIVLSAYAYTLILGETGSGVALGSAMLVAMAAVLGFIIFKR